MKSTKFYDKSLIQTKKDSQFDRDSDRNELDYGKSLAKTANSKKHVSFKNNTSDLTDEVPSRDGVLRKKDVNSVADQIANDKIKQLHQALSEIQQRNQEINRGLTENLTCENPKILEVLMEHIILHWDDIV